MVYLYEYTVSIHPSATWLVVGVSKETHGGQGKGMSAQRLEKREQVARK